MGLELSPAPKVVAVTCEVCNNTWVPPSVGPTIWCPKCKQFITKYRVSIKT